MTQLLFPTLCYRDATAAIDWLEKAFGFERGMVHAGDDGSIAHAELHYGGATLMMGSDSAGSSGWSPAPGGAGVYVVVDDVDAHHARAVEAGAEIVMEPTDQDYGSRDYIARDPEGNFWSFGTYSPAAARTAPATAAAPDSPSSTV